MLFNSLEFILFILIVFILFYLPVLKKWQTLILLIASCVFYSMETPWLLILFLFSMFANAFSSYYVCKTLGSRNSFLIALLGVSLNLFVLFLFKYVDLVENQLPEFISSGQFGAILIALPLPIGISFYTFQGISLIVEVYNGNYKRSGQNKSFMQNLLETSMFISFFPQLIAGPILRPQQFIPQIKVKSIKGIQWRFVFRYLILGYFLKVVIADNLAPITGYLNNNTMGYLSTYTLLIYLYGYSIQIFADFAGYSFIALGLGYLFKYRLIINFNYPYISSTFSGFWRRWHISLSTFLKDYLYIPLGGNKKGKTRTYINLFVVMFLGGLWHGAAWSYAMWGTAHGVFLALERLINKNFTINYKYKIFNFFKIIFVFIIVSFLWLLFKLPEFEDVVYYFKCLLENTNYPLSGYYREYYIIVLSVPIVIYHIIGTFSIQSKKKFVIPLQNIIYSLMLFFIIFNYGPKSDFIYFQF